MLILQQPLTTSLQNSKRFLNDSLKRKYEHFQRDDGVPIYLKGGISDKLLFGTSVVLCVIGLLEGARFLFTMSFPKKK
ncbi:hypothetical protein NQ314_017798 [Rhamnusium bicolor]|uniref:Uncharacterized protein n=1 Tax=Rhamnusium bicolor TaxID=1586634 RepID=A0AAV8WTB5_9CUCU|nr:hypothetical protein NQ314_017798 [Rhamnusium bicolor]